jgi:hypothetical protein
MCWWMPQVASSWTCSSSANSAVSRWRCLLVRRRIHFEGRRAHSAAHVGRVFSGTDDPTRNLHDVRRRPHGSTSTVGSDRRSRWPGRSGEDVGEQFGRSDPAGYLGRGSRAGRRPDGQVGPAHIQSGIEQAGDDTDHPRIACRSATTEDQRSLTQVAHPPCGVDLRLMLVGPRPVGGRRRGAESKKVLCSWESPFANYLTGAPGGD